MSMRAEFFTSSSETTYPEDLTDVGLIRDEIAGMARDNALWLGRKGWVARTVQIKVRYADFTTITRSHSDRPTNDPEGIVRRAVALIEKTEAGPLSPVMFFSLSAVCSKDLLSLRCA